MLLIYLSRRSVMWVCAMVEIEIRDLWTQPKFVQFPSLWPVNGRYCFHHIPGPSVFSLYRAGLSWTPRGETRCLQFTGFQKRQSESLGQSQMSTESRDILFRVVCILFFRSPKFDNSRRICLRMDFVSE